MELCRWFDRVTILADLNVDVVVTSQSMYPVRIIEAAKWLEEEELALYNESCGFVRKSSNIRERERDPWDRFALCITPPPGGGGGSLPLEAVPDARESPSENHQRHRDP